MWWIAAAWAEEPAILQATRVVVVDGIATGAGPVRLDVGGDVVAGESFTLNLDSRLGEVLHGTWTQADGGVLSFERASFNLADGTGTVYVGSFRRAGLRIDGVELALGADGTLIGEHVSFTTCDCEGVAPWVMTANHVEVVPDEVARVRGGALKLFDVPVLPVPRASVPLARRSGFLPPQLGLGDDGFKAAVPLFLTLGRSADTTITPEWRSERSLRAVVEQRYAIHKAAGTTTVTGGWDWQTHSWRGGLDASHTFGDGQRGASVVGRVTSDDRYTGDYADRFLGRQQPWSETRALVWDHSLEIGADYVQTLLPTWQNASIAVRRPETDLGGGLLARAAAGTSFWAFDPVGGPPEQAWVGVNADLALLRPTRVGAVALTPQIAGTSALFGALGEGLFRGEPPGETRLSATVRAELPLWRAGGGSSDQIRPFVITGAQWAFDGGNPWVVTPGVIVAHQGRRGASGASVAVDTMEQTAAFDGYASFHALTGWLQARGGLDGLDLGSVGLHSDVGPVGLGVGWLYAPADQVRQPDPLDPVAVHQLRGDARWTLPGVLSTVTLSGAISRDLVQNGWLSQTAAIRWRHPTGCLALGANARFDDDRTLPDVALTVDIWD